MSTSNEGVSQKKRGFEDHPCARGRARGERSQGPPIPIHVLLVDPREQKGHALLRGLQGKEDIRLVGAGKDLSAACRVNVRALPVDVLVIAIPVASPPSSRSWAVIRLLLPGVRVVALLERAAEELLLECLSAGALAVYPWDLMPLRLVRVLRNVSLGILDLDPEYLAKARHLLM